jgi:hypothetical protein
MVCLPDFKRVKKEKQWWNRKFLVYLRFFSGDDDTESDLLVFLGLLAFGIFFAVGATGLSIFSSTSMPFCFI